MQIQGNGYQDVCSYRNLQLNHHLQLCYTRTNQEIPNIHGSSARRWKRLSFSSRASYNHAILALASMDSCCCCCCSIHPPEWGAGNGKLEIASRPLSPVTQRDLIRRGELAMPSPILHTPVVVHTNSSADAINVPRPACDTDQIHGQCCSALLTAISYVDLASASFCLYPLPLPPFRSVPRLRVQANVELHLVSSGRGEASRVKASEGRHLSDSPQSVKGPCDGGLLL